MKQKADLNALMRRSPVIPVIVIEELDKAVPLARALVRGGLEVLEITLRTPAAMQAIKAVIDDVEGAIVGAGTVLSGTQLEAVSNLGCAFAVSPGVTPSLLDAADDCPCPLLPGAATASEIMHLLDHGHDRMKFFPAEQSGGIPFLKSIASPLPDALFCPTGGIGVGNARDYLALDNVLCVGGSWVAPPALLRDGAWDRITDLALAARALGQKEKP